MMEPAPARAIASHRCIRSKPRPTRKSLTYSINDILAEEKSVALLNSFPMPCFILPLVIASLRKTGVNCRLAWPQGLCFFFLQAHGQHKLESNHSSMNSSVLVSAAPPSAPNGIRLVYRPPSFNPPEINTPFPLASHSI